MLLVVFDCFSFFFPEFSPWHSRGRPCRENVEIKPKMKSATGEDAQQCGNNTMVVKMLQNYVNGKWGDSKSGQRRSCYTPADRHLEICTVPASIDRKSVV